MRRTMTGLILAMAALSPAAAQEWPTRTITLVVPFAPGGGVDISARLQAQAIGDILGQNVIVENIGGGAGMTAGARVAHASPDGYTFMIGNTGTHAYNQSLYKKPLYNSVTDFTPVGRPVMHALGPHQQSRIRLELPVRRERHPEGFEIIWHARRRIIVSFVHVRLQGERLARGVATLACLPARRRQAKVACRHGWPLIWPSLS